MGKFQVVDKQGKVLEIEDGQPVPQGCSVRVTMQMMDSLQKDIRASTAVISDGGNDPLAMYRPGFRDDQSTARGNARAKLMPTVSTRSAKPISLLKRLTPAAEKARFGKIEMPLPGRGRGMYLAGRNALANGNLNKPKVGFVFRITTAELKKIAEAARRG